MTHPIHATFLALEADAKAAVARRHGLAVGMLTIEETGEIARRAAEHHGTPWEEARAILVDHFVPRRAG